MVERRRICVRFRGGLMLETRVGGMSSRPSGPFSYPFCVDYNRFAVDMEKADSKGAGCLGTEMVVRMG